MCNTRLDLPSMLVEAKISDMTREAAHSKLVAEATSDHDRDHKSGLAVFTANVLGFFTRLAALGRRTARPARESASQPQTQSQTMHIPSQVA